MGLGLTGRILIAAGVVVAFLLAEFALVIGSFHAVRHATSREQHAEQAVVAAERLEKLVLDLETGARGYVITRDPAFLQPLVQAEPKLPQQSRALLAAAPGPTARAIDRAWREYERGWLRPLLATVKIDPAAARTRVATGGGKRRVDRLRALIDPLVARELAAANADRRDVASAQHEGVVVGASGIVIAIALFVGIVAYFLRAAVAPVRRIAAATEAIGRGDHGVRVDPGGAGEVGLLARAFNEMSASLERQRASLGEQNADLERLANVLRAVLDSTVDGILLSDAEGNIQIANRPMVALTRDLGMNFDGTVVDRLLSIADRMSNSDEFRAAMERLRDPLAEPTFDEFEDAVSGRVFQGFTSPVHDDRGGFLGRIWTLREVTQQRELDRLKDEFVATVSHELRTPLTSMMGFLEMLREGEAGELTEEQKRFLAIVYRSSERLQRLVGDLLFVARLDANGLQLQYAPVDVAEIVRETVESTSALARTREIDLRAELDDVPEVPADRERLAQLVGNLVSNALKFTPAGGWVAARATAHNGSVVLEVEDSGIGIPYAEQARLFQRFFRSSTATEQAIPGTGLGLVISKAIAEAHGGSISVRSQPGTGTAFRVELPAHRDGAVHDG
ncbi:MAG TPA: ATP-binding protein [Gaiellaceae bacterium]|nr:ATP-binding protein [Gaiellaceae bacterium]